MRKTVKKKAEVMADFLEKEVWSKPGTRRRPRKEKLTKTQTQINMDPFHMREMNDTISDLKNERAAGPDEVPNEFWKWLSPHGKEILLKAYN